MKRAIIATLVLATTASPVLAVNGSDDVYALPALTQAERLHEAKKNHNHNYSYEIQRRIGREGTIDCRPCMMYVYQRYPGGSKLIASGSMYASSTFNAAKEFDAMCDAVFNRALNYINNVMN